MAFTARQKQDIRNVMGAAAVYVDMQHRLEGAMDVIGGNAESAADVIEWLTRISAIDDALIILAGSSAGATYGTLKKVDEVEFYPITKESNVATIASIGMQDQGRILIMRIARILGVSDFLPCGDYFGKARRATSELALG